MSQNENKVKELEQEVQRLKNEVSKGNMIIQKLQQKIGTIEGEKAILEVELDVINQYLSQQQQQNEQEKGE